MAAEAYRAGHGALAWAWLDRAVELNGGQPSPAMRLLDALLRQAVNPHTASE